jgi:hypothetical protein
MFLQSLAVNKNRSRGLFCNECLCLKTAPTAAKKQPTDGHRFLQIAQKSVKSDLICENLWGEKNNQPLCRRQSDQLHGFKITFCGMMVF